jgi:S1-C subfamily serine protease
VILTLTLAALLVAQEIQEPPATKAVLREETEISVKRLKKVTENQRGMLSWIEVEFLQTPPQGELMLQQFELAMSQAFEHVQPQIVHLRIERATDAATEEPTAPPSAIEASGFLLNSQGYVVTLGSILDSAQRVVARFVDRSNEDVRPRRCTVVGTDTESNIGLLNIGAVDKDGLAMDFCSSPPEGSLVLAVGCADSDTPHSAFGLLSARIQECQLGPLKFDELLQVSLQIQPGSAGGVLAQPDGRLVGLLLPPPQWQGQPVPGGVAFALPIRSVQRGVERLLRRQESSPAIVQNSMLPWVGVGCRNLGEALKVHLQVDGGVVVQSVFEDSPALRAGLNHTDLILQWDSEKIRNLEHFERLVREARPDQEIELAVVQKGEHQKVRLRLGQW